MAWFVFKVLKKANKVRVIVKIMVMMVAVAICIISGLLPGVFYESGKMQPGFGEASNVR